MASFLKGREHYPEALGAVAFIQDRLGQPARMQQVGNRLIREFPESLETDKDALPLFLWDMVLPVRGYGIRHGAFKPCWVRCLW